MAHEFLGHAFTLLGDLYTVTGDLSTRDMITIKWTLPATPRVDPPASKEFGFNFFVAPWDGTAWQTFISQPGNSKYAGNDAKYKQQRGSDVIWQNRYSDNFMKSGGSLQTDAFDRFLIYRRIKVAAGEAYSVPEFFAMDQQYIVATDWYAFLGVADRAFTYPGQKSGESSPYAEYDEQANPDDTAYYCDGYPPGAAPFAYSEKTPKITVSPKPNQLVNLDINNMPSIKIEWTYPVKSDWDVFQPDLCFKIYDSSSPENSSGNFTAIVATPHFSEDKKSVTLDLNAEYYILWANTNAKIQFERGKTYILEPCAFVYSDLPQGYSPQTKITFTTAP